VTRPFHVGVVGVGDISDVYFDNLKRYPDIVEVIGCAGRDPDRARRKAEQHGLPRGYPSAAELIADPDIDIVLDLTTPAAHAGINLAAIRAGKHVYTEKPLAATFAEGRVLVAAAQAAGVRIGGAPDTFLGGRLQTCRALIDEGRLGDIVGASAFVVSPGHEWHHPSPDFLYEPGGGPILDIAPYYVTALLTLLGPVTACAAIANRTYPERTIRTGPRRGEVIPVGVDTHVSGTMRFASGAVGTLLASYDVWDSELPKLEIYGTEGVICLPDIDPLSGPNLFGGPVLYRSAEQSRWRGVPRQDPAPEWTEVEIRHPFTSTSHATNSRGVGLVDMAYAIRDGRPARAGSDLLLHAMEVMESLLVSARDERFIRLSTTCERPAHLPVDYPAAERRPA
jgi:predicted dehydrogenase